MKTTKELNKFLERENISLDEYVAICYDYLPYARKTEKEIQKVLDNIDDSVSI